MRFKCGQCATNYNYDESRITGKGVLIKCKNCDNKFTINMNHVIKAADDVSVRYCGNCSNATPINAHKCDKCGLHFNIGKTSLIIDNKDYVSVTEEGGPATQTLAFFKRHRKALVMVIGSLLLVVGICFVPASFFIDVKDRVVDLSGKKVAPGHEAAPSAPMNTEAIFLIDLMNGDKVSAAAVDFDGQQVHIVDEQGQKITIAKTAIAKISSISPAQN